MANLADVKTRELAPASLLTLSPDLLLDILEWLPDVESLKNAVLSCDSLYSAFELYKNRVATKVFKNEVPAQLHKLAIMCRRVMRGHYGFIDLSDTKNPDGTFSDINECFGRIAADKSRTHNMQFTPKAALASAQLFLAITKIEGLGIVKPEAQPTTLNPIVFVPEDGPFQFFGGLSSVARCQGIMNRDTMPTETKMQIIRAIYLWQIVVSLSKDMVFTYRAARAGEVSMSGFVPAVDEEIGKHKVIQFNLAMWNTLMGPMEVLQVLTVHKCFRTFIFDHGDYKEAFNAHLRRVTSSLLPGGCRLIANLAQGSKKLTRSAVRNQLRAIQKSSVGVLGPRQHALCAVLSMEFAFKFLPSLRNGTYGTPWFKDSTAAECWAKILNFVDTIQTKAQAYITFDLAQDVVRKVAASPLMTKALAFWTPAEWNSFAAMVSFDSMLVLEIAEGTRDPLSTLRYTNLRNLGVPLSGLKGLLAYSEVIHLEDPRHAAPGLFAEDEVFGLDIG